MMITLCILTFLKDYIQLNVEYTVKQEPGARSQEKKLLFFLVCAALLNRIRPALQTLLSIRVLEF